MRIFKDAIVITSVAGMLMLTLTGCGMWQGRKARESGRTVNQYQSDIATSDRVEDALKMAPVYKFPDVHVDTFEGNVQLSGFVQTDAQKSFAEKIARQTPGVDRVINNLALIPAPTGRTQGYLPNQNVPVQTEQNNPAVIQPGLGTNTNTVPGPR